MNNKRIKRILILALSVLVVISIVIFNNYILMGYITFAAVFDGVSIKYKNIIQYPINSQEGLFSKPLVKSLGSSNQKVAGFAYFHLLRVRSNEALINLRQGLSDENPDVRKYSCSILGDYKDTYSIGKITQIAFSDQDTDVRKKAILGLGQMRDPRVVSILANFTDDQNPLIREAAVVGLGENGDNAATTILTKKLKDSKRSVRAWVVYSLGKIGTEDAAKALIIATDDNDQFIRNSAIRNLSLISFKKPTQEIKDCLLKHINNPDVNLFVIPALKEYKSKDVREKLIKLLSIEKNTEVRQEIIEALKPDK
jgi:HEAT repeat protein